MSNNKQSSIQWIVGKLGDLESMFNLGIIDNIQYYEEKTKLLEQAKAMQQEQAQLYATFVLMCVNNNLPPITFNDWINLDNNEEAKNT